MKTNSEIMCNRWYKIWYTLCFFALGIIDQRRGSATGEVQMAAANLVGLVAAAMVLPSLEHNRLKSRVYIWWICIAVIGGVGVCIWGYNCWPYWGQWITGVINVVVWGFLILYMLRENEHLALRRKIRNPFFICVEIMLVLMLLSAHKGTMPFLFMILFAGLYLIGIPEEAKVDFLHGMLNGIILWFFVQQSIAFGFRPYDTIRYRGLYSGETQNGLFYMIVYCAFLVKWLWLREKGNKLLCGVSFFLSAGCVSFTLYTGGRSALLGIVLATAVGYIGFDLVIRNSFYKLVAHGILLLVCVMVTFPMVYGCIRYFPVILHHPIWFEGEYGENSSVRSFDPWNSERYTTFEQAAYENLGRIMDVLGIDIRKWRDGSQSGNILKLKVCAMEEEDIREMEGTQEHPYIADMDVEGAMGLRQAIHIYYLKNLNLFGHEEEERGFYVYRRGQAEYIEHAHNMAIQIAYDHGIIAGGFFIGIFGCSLWGAVKKRTLDGLGRFIFLMAILGYGMFEMAVVPGQITVALMGVLFYLNAADVSYELIK